MAHGSTPFLLLFKLYNYLSPSPSLAQHLQVTPSFGRNYFSYLGPCSHCRNVLAQSRRGGAGAWFPRKEAGEQCRKKEAVKEIRGQVEGKIYLLDEHKTLYLGAAVFSLGCHFATVQQDFTGGLASTVCHHLKGHG